MRQNETRSETERHWDNVATTTITLATAATAAVFLIARNGQPEPVPASNLTFFNAMMSLFVTGLYLAVAWIAGRGIFSGSNLSGEKRERWKRYRTHEAFGTFWTILVVTAIIAFTTFTLPGLQSWYQRLDNPNSSTTTASNEGLPSETDTLELSQRT